jgi:uncharacterized protein (TIGR03435 family)
MRRSRILVELLIIGFTLGSASQERAPANSSMRPKVFEVVSIKPNKSGTSGGIQGLPNGERYMNIALDILVKDAYGSFSEDQVVGMPSWAKSDRFDIEVRVDADTANEWKNLSKKERWEQEKGPLQVMLADRCNLKVHFETKELPVYDLMIAKGGLKMKGAAAGEENAGRFSEGELIGHAMPIENLVFALPSDGRPIVDKTGLGDKKFDFNLKWAADNRIEAGDSAPSLFTALEEQLGLKLVSSKAPGKVLVVDHIDRPSPN